MATCQKNRIRETTLKLERIQTCYQQVIFSKYGKGQNRKQFSNWRFYSFGAPGGAIGDDMIIMGSYISFHSENHNLMTLQNLLENKEFSSKGIILGNNIWVGAKLHF
jgi:hypothetical protein